MAWFNAGDILTAKLLNAVMDLVVGTSSPPGVISAYGGAAAPSGWLLCDGSAVSRSTYADLFAAIGTAYGTGDGSSTFNVPDMRGNVPVGLDGATFSALGHTGGEETHALITAELASHTHTFTGNAVASGTESVGHTHTGPSHTHSHSHLSVNTSPGFKWAANFTKTGTGKGVSDVGNTTGSSDPSVANPSTDTDATAGGTGATGGVSATHTHTTTATGTNSNTGSGTAHNNLQPYVTVNFIIKT